MTKAFIQKEELKNHEQRHNKDCKLWECETCGYKTVSASGLSNHFFQLHGSAMIWKCELCDYSTKVKSGLVQHGKIHQKDRARDFHCAQCDQRFFSKHSLKQHEQRHDDFNRTWKCETCDHKSFTKDELKSPYANS